MTRIYPTPASLSNPSGPWRVRRLPPYHVAGPRGSHLPPQTADGAVDLGWGAMDLYCTEKGAVDLDGADSVDLLHGSVELLYWPVQYIYCEQCPKL